MNFNDELEAINFLEKNGILVSIERDIMLPKRNTYEEDVHETIDYLIEEHGFNLAYI